MMSIWMSKIIEMAKKKKYVAEPKHQTTTTSSPTRGSNQDQSGIGVKHDVADYTISDSTIQHIPANQPEWEVESPKRRKKIVKHLLKSVGHEVYKEETINELIAGVGNVRIKPVNMGNQTGKEKATNAPSNVYKMQSAADSRVSQLDQASQQQKDQQKKNSEDLIKQRETAAKKRQSEAPKPVPPGQTPKLKNMQTPPQNEDTTMRFKEFVKLIDEDSTSDQIRKDFQNKKQQVQKQVAQKKIEVMQQKAENQISKMKEEHDIEEARIQFGSGKQGRKKTTGTEDDPGSEHIMMQMRKVISTRGEHKVKHVSGETSNVQPQTAHKVLQHHDNLKTPAEKQAYAARIHRSKSSMSDAMAGKPEEKQPKVSLAGKITGTQK